MFLPLFSLLLFPVSIVADTANAIRFPCLKEVLQSISQLETSARGRLTDMDLLYQRCNSLVISNFCSESCCFLLKDFISLCFSFFFKVKHQDCEIGSLLRSKVQSVPMSLQSITPLRLLAKKSSPGNDSEESRTPTLLRAALGMTPAELAAKPKYRKRTSFEVAKHLLRGDIDRSTTLTENH